MVEGQDAIEENDICSIDSNGFGQPAAGLEVILQQLGTYSARMCGLEWQSVAFFRMQLAASAAPAPAAAGREESSNSAHYIQAAPLARHVLLSSALVSSRQLSLLQMSHLGYLDWSALLQGAQALHNLVKCKGVGVVKVEVSN